MLLAVLYLYNTNKPGNILASKACISTIERGGRGLIRQVAIKMSVQGHDSIGH